MSRIICLIPTKNRFDYLKESLNSVLKQKHKPDYIIVSSDSNTDLQIKEEQYCTNENIIYIKNQRTHNLSGNLNNGLLYILANICNFKVEQIKNTFIALLDDDDYWLEDYLSICNQLITNETIGIISPIKLLKDGSAEIIKVKKEINYQDFLVKNPGIQGSNTFLRLDTFLKCGMYDENLSASTDRDLFVRIFMIYESGDFIYLNDCYVIARFDNNHERITNNKLLKKQSFIKFYYKYESLMNENLKTQFIERCNYFTDLSLEDLKDKTLCLNNKTKKKNQINCKQLIQLNYDNLIFGFISSNKTNTLSLLDDILKISSNNQIIIFWNSNQTFKLSNKRVKIYNLKDVFKIWKNNPYFKSLINIDNSQLSIANARLVLNYLLYINSNKNHCFWILDDDMKLIDNHQSVFDINTLIDKYYKLYDVVVGSYYYEPPISLILSLRNQLVDYTYHHLFNKKSWYSHLEDDYYYDLSTINFTNLETPNKTKVKDLKSIFNHKVNTRYVNKSDSLCEFEPYTCGGNILIFNRDVLLIPQLEMRIDDWQLRRTDYFWIRNLINIGYKVIGSTFAIKHHRGEIKFNYEKEILKALKDIIGSCFVKAFIKSNSSNEMINNFNHIFQMRFSAFISNYYRIHSLLKLNNDKMYLSSFNFDNLRYWIHQVLDKINPNKISSLYYELLFKIKKYKHIDLIEKIKHILSNDLNSKINLLGFGCEGIVYNDSNYVYKYFYDEDNFKYLQSINNEIKDLELFDNLEFLSIGNLNFIRYKFYDFKEYKPNDIKQIVNFIKVLIKHRIVIENIKRQNFILVNNQMKFIDYSKSIIINANDNQIEEMIKHFYIMFMFANLDENQYWNIIVKLHNHNNEIFYKYDEFKMLIYQNHKELTHDLIVIDLINKLEFNSMLDYGCGKCKIANLIALKKQVDVYDIDLITMKQRASNNVHIIESYEDLNQTYDLVNCNLVLCVVDDKECIKIIQKLATLTNKHLILSICNPYFDDINQTSEKLKGYSGLYHQNKKYIKQTDYIKREEYHRSFEFYERILNMNGFNIDEIKYDLSSNANNLKLVSERLILKCSKIDKHYHHDCSILIKTNSMDYRNIDKSIMHIINKIECFDIFKQRVVVVDVENKDHRVIYDDFNKKVLIEKLNILKQLKYIDKIIFTTKKDIKHIYGKYFSKIADNTHAQNKQNILSILKGFDYIKTKYVFQTDCDILYFNSKPNKLNNIFNELKNSNYLSSSIGSFIDSNQLKYDLTNKFEIRTCFLNLMNLSHFLKFNNPIVNHTYQYSIQQCIFKLNKNINIRTKNQDLFFLHCENDIKQKANILPIIRQQFSLNNPCWCNNNDINLTINNLQNYRIKDEIVVYIRGRNTNVAKSLKLIESLKRQTYQNFRIVYIDDHSDFKEYNFLRMMFTYDLYLKNKSLFYSNDKSIKELKNFQFLYQYLLINDETIIINIDSDDYLIDDYAIEKIKQEFDKGCDVTVGNCYRVDKPLKNYTIYDFNEVYNHDGDNIWLHPKCFKKYLCNFITNEFKNKKQYLQTCCDFAIMFPVINYANKPGFIKDILYLYEPSLYNQIELKKLKKNDKQYLLNYAKLNYSRTRVILYLNDEFNDINIKTINEFIKSIVDKNYIFIILELNELTRLFISKYNEQVLNKKCNFFYIKTTSSIIDENLVDVIIPLKFQTDFIKTSKLLFYINKNDEVLNYVKNINNKITSVSILNIKEN